MERILTVDAGPSQCAVLYALPGAEPAAWPRTVLTAGDELKKVKVFLEEGGLPAPERVVLTSSVENATPSHGQERMDYWRMILSQHDGRAEAALGIPSDGSVLESLCSEASSLFGTSEACDVSAASVLASLRYPALLNRCWSEGVTVIYAGRQHIRLFMVYQEKVWGLYEHHSDLPLEILKEHLKEMRFNWLPNEQVRVSGGHGCLCGELPAEAEGFRPTYIFGPQSHRLTEFGRIVSPCGDPDYERCFGMVEAVLRRKGC